LLRGALRSAGFGSWAVFWRETRGLLFLAALWLAAGLFFAHLTGRDNRTELLQNRLRGTAVRAMSFDTAALTNLARDNYGLVRGKFIEAGLQPAPRLADAAGAELRRQMLQEHNATVYTDRARLVVLHDGWLMAVASSSPSQPPGTIELIRRATPQDEADWAGAHNLIESSPVAEVGQPYYTRAALAAHGGAMLGWLEFSREEFFQSLGRKWRVGPLLVTALGLVLGAQAYLQRRGAREREAALRAAAIAAEANRLKTSFLAKVSHELRTPIQSLLGYGELLQGRLGGDAQAGAWLAALQQHGEIMTRLVNDLLDLSAAEAGAFRLAPQTVSPGALVRQLADSLAARAASRGLAWQCSVSPAVPAWVEADGNRLAQIVLNLGGNALKFTDTGEVQLALDAVPEADGRVRLELTVRDTGPGISPADQATLFEPFTRLAPTAAKEGSGLGLALSRTLCRAMAGDLTVESDGRHGSCFRATFRVARADAPGPRTAAAPAARGPARVLVIEDNTLVRELFQSFLGGRGCACLAARTGTEGLALARAGAPEAIVLDLSLPDADGLALVPALRALVPGGRIVAVSAHAGEAERARAQAAGVDAFFTKPVPLDRLWAALGGDPVTLPPASRPGAPFLAAFHRELPGLHAELAAAVAAGDLPRVRFRAHYLVNSALVVEARDLLEAGIALERAAEQGGPAAAAAAWSRCETIILRLLQRAA
jgi:signal transduction histidine kinase/ActR/RegA family two-component response regulator